MDKISTNFKSVKRTSRLFSSNPIYSQPTLAKNHSHSSIIKKTTLKDRETIKNCTANNSITKFYQQKKRLNTSNDSSNGSKSMKSPLKKYENKLNDLESSSNNSSDHLPIGWKTTNTSVDCKLKVNYEQPVDQELLQQDANLSFKRNELKMDQMLNEFYNKLQFNVLSMATTTNKETEKDSGHENGAKDESNNDLDELLEDSWASKDFLDELNEAEKKMTTTIPKPSTSDQSKESGVSSCNSLDLNKQIDISPKVTTSNTSNRFNGMRSSQEENRCEINKFKIPETPNQKTKSIITSTQFNSTPKVVGKQSSKSNQSLFFENLSPIKGNHASLVNIRQEGKRPLNNSMNCDNNACKKRNGRILFSNGSQPIKSEAAKNDDTDDMVIDDSFDILLSQLNDEAFSQSNKRLREVKTSAIPEKTASNSFIKKPNFTKAIVQPNRQVSSNHQVNPNNTKKILSNLPFKNDISPSSRSAFSTPRSTRSSIQFEDDSSTLFARETNNMQYAHNLKHISQQRSTVSSPNAISSVPEAKKEKVSTITKSTSVNQDEYWMDEDDADLICSQVVI